MDQDFRWQLWLFEELIQEDLLKAIWANTELKVNLFDTMIWDRVPKSWYVSFLYLEFGVYYTVANYNIIKLIFEKLDMIINVHASKECQILNRKHLDMKILTVARSVRKLEN